MASAIGSTVSGFFSTLVSSFLVSVTCFGGSGFFSTGFSTCLGCGGGAVSVTTGAFSLILPTASSTGLASATFSASCLGFSFLPVFMPAATCENWSAEITSTGTESSSGVGRALVGNETMTHPNTRRCRTIEATSVLLILTFKSGLPFQSGNLFAGRSPFSRTLLRNDDDIGLEPGGADLSQQFHHIRVADVPVAAQVNHALGVRPRLPDSLDFGQQIGSRNRRIAQIQLDIRITTAFGAFDRQGQWGRIRGDRLAAARDRQIDIDVRGHQRGCHHEDDQQHEHHVHHRRDVDFRHHGFTPAAASAARRACHVHRHVSVLTIGSQISHNISNTGPHARSSIWRDRMAENSSAKPSRRWACRFTSEVNLL